MAFSHIHVRVGRQVRGLPGRCRCRLGRLAAGRPGVSKADRHCLLRAPRCVVNVLSGLTTSRRQILAMFQMGGKKERLQCLMQPRINKATIALPNTDCKYYE